MERVVGESVGGFSECARCWVGGLVCSVVGA